MAISKIVGTSTYSKLLGVSTSSLSKLSGVSFNPAAADAFLLEVGDDLLLEDSGRLLIDAIPSASYSGIKISMTHTNWIGIVEVDIWDVSQSDISDAECTTLAGATGKSITLWSQVGSGEYGTSSTYTSNASAMNDGWAGTSIMWNSSAGAAMDVFFRFTQEISLSRIRMKFQNTASYGYPQSITFYDTNDAQINNLTGPINPTTNEYYWTF